MKRFRKMELTHSAWKFKMKLIVKILIKIQILRRVSPSLNSNMMLILASPMTSQRWKFKINQFLWLLVKEKFQSTFWMMKNGIRRHIHSLIPQETTTSTSREESR